MLRRDVQPVADLHRRDAAVAELVASLDVPAVFMLFAMLALPFVLFMFLDQLALMLVLIPIYQPLLKLYAFDPIWFWTLFLIVATVGGLTRRSAMCCLRSRARRPSCRQPKSTARPGHSCG